MFSFGVDYYPEQWPEERWAEDARLMAEAGFNVVRLAEFAWSKLEPEPGRFDFAWLDRAIALLAGSGMRVVLGTPTASPPPWLMSRHPSLFLVGQDGRSLTFGHRREYCPSNPLYLEYARNIVEGMSEHYSDNPAVIGWQVDNEFGDRCYCSCCAGAFHQWLRERYSTLDNVNDRWGTIFWSHVYTAWEQIPVPLSTGGSPNPGLALDYYRFCSDSYVAFQQAQIDILRRTCPAHFITHNFMGFKYDRINAFDLARSLDFVSWDNYPRNQWNMDRVLDPVEAALGHDTMRGLKRLPFWVIEQQAGSGGWEVVSPAPRPGQLRLWAYQSIAHGASGVLFFRWRTARAGAEQYWHGLLDHDGRPGRRYQEIRQMGREVTAVGDRLAGTRAGPRVAMLLSYDSRFAFQIQANNPRFSYESHFAEIYATLQRLQVAVDVVAPEDDLTDYALVFAPALHIVSERAAANLRAYVSAGGVLAVTPRSGVKDDANRVVNQPLPGLLSELCGVEVEEYDSLPEDKTNAVRFTINPIGPVPDVDVDEGVAPVEVWADVLRPIAASVVAVYEYDYYAGRPAITLNRFGSGHAIYMGVFGSRDLLMPVTRWLLKLAGMLQPQQGPDGVEILQLNDGERIVLFLLNHTDKESAVDLQGLYRDLLCGSMVECRVTVGPYDVRILEQEKGG